MRRWRWAGCRPPARVKNARFSDYPPGIPQFSYSWSPLPLLPPRFQNHCGYFNGNYVCANHCGPNYQFYYCSDWSSGCCHIGLGYCNPGGILRCNPHYFPFY